MTAPPPGPATGTAQDAVAAWVEENLTYEHFRDWGDDDFAKALIAAFPALAAPSGPQAAAGEVHRPFTDDGVTYCGWDGHEGCGELWPCSYVRDRPAPPGGER